VGYTEETEICYDVRHKKKRLYSLHRLPTNCDKLLIRGETTIPPFQHSTSEHYSL